MRITENVTTGEIGKLTDKMLEPDYHFHRIVTQPSETGLQDGVVPSTVLYLNDLGGMLCKVEEIKHIVISNSSWVKDCLV